MTCANPECGHDAKVHNESGCRRTKCSCTALVIPEPEQLAGPRRIAIDVPDGYMVTVSLVPYTEQPEAET